MKRRITLSIAIALGIALISLINPDSTVNAQNQLRDVADSGAIPLGHGQVLRLTVISADGEPGGEVSRIRFRQIGYAPDVCNRGGICKSTIASQTTTGPITLGQGEAASVDVSGPGYWRIIVESNDRNVRTNGVVFDTSTQRVVAMCCTSNTMYWP